MTYVRRLFENILPYSVAVLFNTFLTVKCLRHQSVCLPSDHALTLVEIFGLQCNFYILLRFTIKLSLLKMKCVALIVRLQRYTNKFFIIVYGIFFLFSPMPFNKTVFKTMQFIYITKVNYIVLFEACRISSIRIRSSL